MLRLALQILFTMSFCVVLRELRRENCLRGERNEEGLCLSPINGSSVSSPDDGNTWLLPFPYLLLPIL